MIKIYATMLLSVVLYGYVTWSLILDEEHRHSYSRTRCREE
jgi:hypothetical protein